MRGIGEADVLEAPGIVDELRQRAERLRSRDPVSAARALIELGVYAERVERDRGAARSHYESARSLVRTLQPALTRVRRLIESRTDLAHALAVIVDELAVAESDDVRTDLLAERARLYASMNCFGEARESYEQALAINPHHAASLRGYEAVLREELGDDGPKALADSLAEHLDRVADAYAPAADRHDGDARLAAWILVQQAEILDRRLNKPDLAQLALERAVKHQPEPGPVREALRQHLILHRADKSLVGALCVEGEQERDDDRATRLFYAAARLTVDRLRAPADAVMILSRASVRAPAGSPTNRRILEELIRQLESTGNLELSAATRQKRLPLLKDRDQVAHEHVRLSEIFSTLGKADRAVEAAAQALKLDPYDSATRERLDRAFQRLGEHDERVRLWVNEANANRPIPVRVAAYLRASDIAQRNMGRNDLALKHLRAAWALDPHAGEVFDALAGLLAPPARDETSEVRGVRERLELYSQAAAAADEPARKIAFLEKLVALWEEELSQPKRAMEVLERILEIDPRRRSAIVAMQRNAERAGDASRLADALRVEAELTKDPKLGRRLLLRASNVLETRVGDATKASQLVERALEIGPADGQALLALYRLRERTSRYDDAREALTRLIAIDPGGDESFGHWIEVARLDEIHRRKTHDAVAAYQEAAKIKPLHPLPPLEIARLLREVAEFKRLCDSLEKLAVDAPEPEDRAAFYVQAAEVYELCAGDDSSALTCLDKADEALREATADPSIDESRERILVRRDSTNRLISHYAKWLEKSPPTAVDHALRLSLSRVLERSDAKQAAGILAALVEVVRDHVPALRQLERLQRSMADVAQLGQTLQFEAQVFTSSLARCGALWELVSLEEQVGPTTALQALARITVDAPRDGAAYDAIIRIASRVTGEVALGHPAAMGAHKQLLEAIRARRELTSDPIGNALFHLEEAGLYESLGLDEAAHAHAALSSYKEANALWPESVLAARGLERIGAQLGDKKSVARGALALADLAFHKVNKAGHLVQAAELVAELGQFDAGIPSSLELYERALRANPDSVAAAESLDRLLVADPSRLCERLGEALEHAKDETQIVRLGMAIGRAALGDKNAIAAHLADVPADISAVIRGDATEGVADFGVGIAALRRALEVAPEDVEVLLLLAKLQSAQQLWAESRDTLLRVVDLSTDPRIRVYAHFSMAQLYEGPLSDLDMAETALVAALAIEPRNKHALEHLYQVGLRRKDAALIVSTLERLADYETDPTQRVEYDIRLAEACRESGDESGRVRALCDAVVTQPKEARPWMLLSQAFRLETNEGMRSLARAVDQIVELATRRQVALEPRWLVTAGLIEAQTLQQPARGVEYLQRAAGLGAPLEARVALALGLAAAGRHSEATQHLRELLTTDGERLLRLAEPAALTGLRVASVAPSGTVLAASLSALEASLATEGLAEERLAVEEVRASIGEVRAERVTALRARRLKGETPFAGGLAGSELSRLLVPEARSPLVDVAIALAPVAAKALRFDLGNVGVSSRDRIGPRDGHPTRMLLERLARCIGVEEFELYLSPSWQGGARVFPGDPPAIVGPISLPDLPEPEQVFALSRLLTRIALGVTWLDELSVEDADGLLLATLRAVEANYAVGALTAVREQAVAKFLTGAQKAIGRRQRRALEEVLPNTTPTYDARSFVIGIRRSEYRAAYVMTGDLVCSVDYLRRFERDLTRATESPRVLLQHPVTNELMRFAMTREAYTQRRRLGTVWAPI